MKPTLFSLLLAVGSLLSSPVWADDQTDPPDDGSRSVARISVMHGDVSVRRGDSSEVVAAAANVPLVVQDSLMTGAGARAEIEFDSANLIRLGENAEVHLTDLAYHRAQMQIAYGTVMFRAQRDSDSQMEIDTPQVAVRPAKRGSYRITVREDGTSEIAVRSGEAEIFTPHGSQTLRSGKMMIARGTATDPEFQVVQAPALDEWDQWNDSRDHQLGRTRSYDYVNRDISGAEDLDNNGDWVDSQYGRAWHPRVASDWAPYRDGHWAWVDYYGWTWIGDESWGWAPYHYGNWFDNGSLGWCWYPGAYYNPHYYWSPALVGFVGFGHGGFGLGFGFGNIGWVPLAPFEPCYRWWGRGFYGGAGGFGRFGGRNSIVNNINVSNVYRNSRVPNGMTAVNAAQFGQSRGNYMKVSQGDLRGASMVKGQVPVAPTRQSLNFSNRAVNSASIARTQPNRTFFTHQQPQQVTRVPFEQQRQGMEQTARQSFTRTPADGAGNSATAVGRSNQTQIVPRQPASSMRGGVATQEHGFVNPDRPQSASSGSNSTQNSGGWRRFGEPQRTQPATVPSSTATRSSDIGGWRRFGEPGRAASPVDRQVDRQTSAPRQSYSDRPSASQFGGSGSNPIHVSPSIVRERPSYGGGASGSYRPTPAPSYGGGGSSYHPAPAPSYGGGGSSYHPAPAPSYGGGGSSYHPAPAPSYRSAPAPSYHSSPAPSRSYSSGGSSHSSGGSSHSSGGGGGSHSGGSHR